MAQSQTIEVFQALERGQLRQMGLSVEQVRRLCPESSGPGWTMKSALLPVAIAQGTVLDWGGGREHVHWQCPLCGREHISDFEPHADSNPSLWFCEGGEAESICLVYWQRAQDADQSAPPDRPRD